MTFFSKRRGSIFKYRNTKRNGSRKNRNIQEAGAAWTSYKMAAAHDRLKPLCRKLGFVVKGKPTHASLDVLGGYINVNREKIWMALPAALRTGACGNFKTCTWSHYLKNESLTNALCDILERETLTSVYKNFQAELQEPTGVMDAEQRKEVAKAFEPGELGHAVLVFEQARSPRSKESSSALSVVPFSASGRAASPRATTSSALTLYGRVPSPRAASPSAASGRAASPRAASPSAVSSSGAQAPDARINCSSSNVAAQYAALSDTESRPSTKSEAKKKYLILARKYHPDTLSGASEQARNAATETFKNISEAWSIISKC